MHRFPSLLAGLVAAALAAPVTAVADSPGLEAIQEFRAGRPPMSAVENRFFLRQGRFEIAPMMGYVPNNPFSYRYTGAVNFGYYFTETLGVSGQFLYSPDRGINDLKGLTIALVRIAYNGPGGADFQQPLDKITLAGNFGVTWAPLYGKINLIGEKVVNFDLHGNAALGVVSKVNYHAEYVPNAPPGSVPVRLVFDGNEVKVAPVLGVGANFFVSQTAAFKIDARSMIYIDEKPQYDRNSSAPVENRVYNNFIASAGVSLFFPKMAPRVTNF